MINEYTNLNERLNKHGLSTQDVNKLVKFVMTLRDMDRFQKCWSKDE